MIDGRLEEAIEIGERASRQGEVLGEAGFGRQAAAVLSRNPLIYLGRAEEVLAQEDQISGLSGLARARRVLR